MQPSYWSGEIGGEADLIIVGAGFAGLSSAFACAAARSRARIVVLDRKGPGAGASGRNGGMIIPFPLIPLWLIRGSAPGHEPETLNHLLMRQLAATLDGPVGQAVAAREAPFVVAASSGFWVRALRWLAERAGAMGVAVEGVGPDELRAKYASATRFALRYRGHGIQPWRAAQGLAEAAAARGVTILSGVEALRFENANGTVRVTTDSGVLTARDVLIATNAYGETLAGLPPLGMRLFSYVLATDELTPDQATAVGGEALFSEVDTGIYRRIEDGRLIFGALDKPRANAAETHATDPKARQQLRELLARSLPSLAGVPVAREWGGAFMQRVGPPIIAPHPGVAGVWLNTGYGGSGVALSLLSGPLAAGMMWPDADTPEAAAIRAGYRSTRMPWLQLPGVALAILRAGRGGNGT
jgi:gamma-glutamylputrescine oxidase